MSKSKQIAAWIILGIVSLNTPVFAGPGASGGGGSIVCFYSPDTLSKVRAQGGKLTFADLGMDEQGQELPGKGTVESIEAYDLFEAEISKNLGSGAATPVLELLPSETYAPGYEGPQNYAAYIERVAHRYD